MSGRAKTGRTRRGASRDKRAKSCIIHIMNTRRKVCLLLLLSVAVPLLVANQRRLNSVPNVLARYPQSPELDFAVQGHLEYKPTLGWYDTAGKTTQTTFYATWFPTGKVSEQIHSGITGAGQDDFSRLIFSPSKYNFDPPILGKMKQYGRGIHLNNTQFLNVREWVKQMPPSDPPDRVGDLMIITFNQGTKYETRLYDRTDLPQIVKDLCSFIPTPLQN